MINANIEAERHTIPRWNSIYVSEELGEMSALKLLKHEHSTDLLEKQFTKLLNAWKNEKNITLAGEIISTARAMNSKENIDDIIKYAKKRLNKVVMPPNC